MDADIKREIHVVPYSTQWKIEFEKIKDMLNSYIGDLIMRIEHYLRSHEAARREYESLKLELAEKYRNDRDSYSLGKTDFVQKVLACCSYEKE